MSMKIKPIKIVVVVYGSGIVVGLVLCIAGIILKLNTLIKIGLVLFLVGLVIGSIPLIGSCTNLLWKKLFKQKP